MHEIKKNMKPQKKLTIQYKDLCLFQPHENADEIGKIKGATEHGLKTLKGFVNSDHNLKKLKGICSSITKKENRAALLCRQAIKDLELVVKHIESLGIEVNLFFRLFHSCILIYESIFWARRKINCVKYFKSTNFSGRQNYDLQSVALDSI